jgi:hypothetical protein
MQKTILSLCSIIIAIALFFTAAVPVMADNGKNQQELTQSNRAELIIRMTDKVDVGQPVAITVYTKHGHNTVSQAMVYALNTSQLTITADNANYNITSESYADVAVQQGLFLGYTGNDGRVEYAFQDTGRYIIIAIKDGFIPGMDYLTVNLAAVSGLVIKAPDSVVAGKNAIFKVTERDHGIPVDNAALYAMEIGGISTSEVVDSTVALPYELENVDDITTNGIFMGYSNNGGIVRFQFTEAGNYIVVAIKDSYAPGYHKIMVTSTQSSLLIRVPDSAQVDEEVKIMVVERGTGDAISGAAVYAMKRLSDVQTLNRNAMQLKSTVAVKAKAVAVNVASSNQTTTSPVAVAYPSVDEVKTRGIFLGNTNDEGLLVHAFEEAGQYVIVAVYEGYNSGFSNINIRNNNLNQLYIRVPSTAIVNQEITIAVVERNTHEPVEDVALYASIAIPVAVSSPVIGFNDTTSQGVLQADGTVSDNGTDEIPVRELIGYTDEKGQVVYAFTESGRYNITAVKDGYTSSSALISVLLSAPSELKVALPARARIDDNINIKVLNRYDGNPEEGAAVYALEYNSVVRELSPVVSSNETDISSRAEIYADMAISTGTYIGDTDENGEVTYAFGSTGQYLVVAIKEGFVPGFNKISILGMVNGSLLLRVQDEAKVNIPLIIATVDKATSDNVSDVDIYAYKMEGFAASLGFTFREAFSFGNTARQNLAMSVSDNGFYIGTTDESGILEYTFNEEGQYLLIAFKAGYSPDFERIEVISPDTN